ncbi:MAG: globin [Exilibacterium sp.]
MSFENTFDASYERILHKKIAGKSFFDTFYDNFMSSSKEVRERFKNTDMARQKRMLKKSFYSLFIFYASSNADDYLVKIATHHNSQNLNIRPELYDIWLDTLVKTVETFDHEFSKNVELAWRLVLAPGITYMKFKHTNL